MSASVTHAEAYTFVTKWGIYGSSNGQFVSPRDIAIDSSDNVYVSDSSNNLIQKFSGSGTYITKWGSYGDDIGQFLSPEGIALDSSGNVYIADRRNNFIQKFSGSGKFITRWGSHWRYYSSEDGQLLYPTGVAVDSSGNVYVVEEGNRRVQKFVSNNSAIPKIPSIGMLAVLIFVLVVIILRRKK